MAYSWQDEVNAIRRQAQQLRLKAQDVRYAAEKQATALEADADRSEMRARQLQRLCSGSGEAGG